MRNKDKSLCCGIINTWDCLTVFIMANYFLWVSRDYFNLALTMTVLGAASKAFLLLLAPESPRWLVAKGR